MSIAVTALGKYPGYDSLHLHHAARKASAHIVVYTLVDKDTKQYILYSPSLDISSYGETEAKATEMFNSSVDYFFSHIINLPLKKCEEELQKIGWKSDWLRKKDFTKASTDISEQAETFNAEIKSVQHFNIAA